MKLTMQTIQPVPNAVYVPQFILQTGINNGKPVTSCQITLAAANLIDENDKNEQWSPTGQTRTIYLPNIVVLEPELEKLGAQISQFYTNLMAILESINFTKKVL